jgi:hypothetical protein
MSDELYNDSGDNYAEVILITKLITSELLNY